MQERTIAENEVEISCREFFKQKKGESQIEFSARMANTAKHKLQDPRTDAFRQIRIGRNQSCPCGSGKKFKKCCLGKANQGEFKA